MASYRYPRRSRRGSMPSAGQVALAVGVAAALAAGAGHTVTARAGTHHHHGPPARSATAAQAIRYARHRLGLPYCWGGIGPSCYDCSGLVYEAYTSAGVTIPRTSQAQWAALRHVSHPRPGDLVFFPGSDGTWAAPGHVALVIAGSRMIQAYATGTPIEVSPLNGAGAGGIVGYARPAGA